VVDNLIFVTQKELGVTVVPTPIAAEKTDFLSQQHIKVVLPSPKWAGRYSLQINNQRETVVRDGVVIYQ
jgi:hypothetical protein